MKKSTKIILPALAVLVLGTAAAATGTVAWFAANGVVSATGMQVKCATSKNLLIANIDPTNASNAANFTEEKGAYGASVVTTNTGVKTLNPSSTSATAIKTPSFYVAKDKIGAVAGEIKDGAKIVTGANNTDYAEHDFWVANSATANMSFAVSSLKATVLNYNDETKTYTETDVAASAAISKALRVGVVYRDNVANADVVKIYAVVDGATLSYQGLTGTSDSVTVGTDKVVKDGTTPISETTTAVLSSSVIDPTAQTPKMDSLGSIKSTTSAVTDATKYEWSSLKVFIWYEGQDAACTANNALSVENVNVSLSFTANEIAD